MTAGPNRNSPSAWEELSPALRDAVKRVCRDPLPPGLAERATVAARVQTARYPRRQRQNLIAWGVPAVAASLALISLGVFAWAMRADAARMAATPQAASRTTANNSTTAGTYAQAARQSPETLYSLLDWQWRNPGKPRSSAHSNETIHASMP